MTIEKTLPSWVEEGVKARYRYHRGQVDVIAHIRAVIDGMQVVYAVWSKKRQRYYYYLEPVHIFAEDIALGKIEYAGKDTGWMAKGYTCEK